MLPLLLFLAGCNSGGGDYKSEATMVLGKVKDELASEPNVKPATKQRLDDLIAKYKAEDGEKMSFKNIVDVQGALCTIDSNPQMAVPMKQAAQEELQKALSDLATEGAQ